MFPDQESNPQLFLVCGTTLQPTEPRWPGPELGTFRTEIGTLCALALKGP